MLSTRDAETVEDVGYFFKHVGGVRFSPSDIEAAEGNASVVAASSRYGITIFSDMRGNIVF